MLQALSGTEPLGVVDLQHATQQCRAGEHLKYWEHARHVLKGASTRTMTRLLERPQCEGVDCHVSKGLDINTGGIKPHVQRASRRLDWIALDLLAWRANRRESLRGTEIAELDAKRLPGVHEYALGSDPVVTDTAIMEEPERIQGLPETRLHGPMIHVMGPQIVEQSREVTTGDELKNEEVVMDAINVIDKPSNVRL